jgi:hypothetical protein
MSTDPLLPRALHQDAVTPHGGHIRKYASNAQRQRSYRSRQRVQASLESDVALAWPAVYWGGKRAIAPEVWRAFGPIRNYIEPFGGLLSVLLGRPRPFTGLETVGDPDGVLVNLYTATQYAPREVARFADQPLHELLLWARSDALALARAGLTARLMADPRDFDAELAGWLLWGLSSTTSSGFAQKVGVKPHAHMAHTGSGLHAGNTRAKLPRLLQQIARRLKYVRLMCGTWERCVTDSMLGAASPCGVFLDPPYALDRRHHQLYAVDSATVAHEVAAWARAHGEDTDLRIALCALPGEHEMPADWTAYHWTARGGMKNTGTHGRGNGKTRAEVLWLSPHCQRVTLL